LDDTVKKEDEGNVVFFDTFDSDTIAVEKQQRLLTEPLYSSWAGPGEGRTFLVAANVGILYHPQMAPIVPDVLVSLDVQVADDWREKHHQLYVCGVFGKPPDIVIEIVSNQDENEDTGKVITYSRAVGVSYYIIYDPQKLLSQEVIQIYERRSGGYGKRTEQWFASVGLGVMLWKGTYEGKENVWLRWCDEKGTMILTEAERTVRLRSRET